MDKNTIPVQAIDQLLSTLGYEWHSSDYYISPEENFIADAKNISPVRLNFYGLFLCIKGCLEVEINNEIIRIEPNCFSAVGPNAVLQKYVQSPDCKHRALIFTKDFLLKNIINSHQFESFEFFTKNTVSSIQLTQSDAEPLLQLYDILKTKRDELGLPYQIEIIRNLFFAYLYEVAIIYQKRGMVIPPKFTREVDLNYRFQQLLGEYGLQQHNLKFYADSLFITSKHLINAIKKVSGKTPGELIDERIITIAKVQLKNINKSIAAIAEELLFSDQASFSKFFKRHTGYTPLQFRQEI